MIFRHFAIDQFRRSRAQANHFSWFFSEISGLVWAIQERRPIFLRVRRIVTADTLVLFFLFHRFLISRMERRRRLALSVTSFFSAICTRKLNIGSGPLRFWSVVDPVSLYRFIMVNTVV